MLPSSRSLLVFVLIAMNLTSGFVMGQTQWSKYASNPILSPSGSWDSGGVIFPHVLFDGAIFRMWYEGLIQGKYVGIGYATSTDGRKWVADSQPVLTANGNGWDASGITLGSVLWNGTDFALWYRGYGNGVGALGLAFSHNGMNWTKYQGNPIDSTIDSAPRVIQVGADFKMWYDCQSPTTSFSSICYATSSDGKTWNKYSSPVLTREIGDYWDSGDLWGGSVIYDGSVYGMWYTAASSNASPMDVPSMIGYATSKDGITWTRDPDNPILSNGRSGAWDSFGPENPCVIQYNSGFIMFYDVYNGESAHIGMAQSPANFVLPEFTTPYFTTILLITIGLLVYRRRPARKCP